MARFPTVAVPPTNGGNRAMTPCQPTEAAPDCQGPSRWDRSQTVALLEQALDPEAPSSLPCCAARHTLPPTMPRRKITLCQDENFHHGPPCLVTVEPVSNFILLEARSAKRDADSWDKAVGEALQGLPVEVVQGTSDEAKGILAHVRDGLGA